MEARRKAKALAGLKKEKTAQALLELKKELANIKEVKEQVKKDPTSMADPHELKKLRARELELKRIFHAFEEKARFKRQAREQKEEKIRKGEMELEKQRARVREQTDEEKWTRSRRKYSTGLTPKSMKEMN